MWMCQHCPGNIITQGFLKIDVTFLDNFTDFTAHKVVIHNFMDHVMFCDIFLQWNKKVNVDYNTLLSFELKVMNTDIRI